MHSDDQVRLYFECMNFLYHEANLLDSRKLNEWVSLMTEDVDYRVPLRITRDRSSGPGFSDKTYYFKEHLGSLKTRVARFETEFAWSEDPPSRIRHFVSNLVMEVLNEKEVEMKYNLLIYRYRLDNPSPDTICGERQDVLRKVNGEWKIAKRVVFLDSTVLNTSNLSIFI